MGRLRSPHFCLPAEAELTVRGVSRGAGCNTRRVHVPESRSGADEAEFLDQSRGKWIRVNGGRYTFARGSISAASTVSLAAARVGRVELRWRKLALKRHAASPLSVPADDHGAQEDSAARRDEIAGQENEKRQCEGRHSCEGDKRHTRDVEGGRDGGESKSGAAEGVHRQHFAIYAKPGFSRWVRFYMGPTRLRTETHPSSLGCSGKSAGATLASMDGIPAECVNESISKYDPAQRKDRRVEEQECPARIWHGQEYPCISSSFSSWVSLLNFREQYSVLNYRIAPTLLAFPLTDECARGMALDRIVLASKARFVGSVSIRRLAEAIFNA
ncbi:hypothetical protein C8R44DRAFT_733874 [Mycena epipterygia]|nr:hypothetical protein C8R44DRAFT_733874 [Mycena epipterygia]